jgi:hypothetical protein
VARYKVWFERTGSVVVEAETVRVAKRRALAAHPDKSVHCASLINDGWTPRAEWTEEGPCLVWLEKPVLGSQVQVANIHPNTTVVGGRFSFEAPAILFCRPLPACPAMVTLEAGA